MAGKFSAGETLGDYEVIDYIGKGAVAEVYHVRRQSDGAEVALKLLMPGPVAEAEEFEQRFKREAELLETFDHPNILPVYAYGKIDKYYFIEMMLMRGGTVEEVIQRDGSLPLARVREILSQVASALDYVHQRSVIHRDMKPANIMLDGDGTAYLADFGIAKAQKMSNLTTPGVVLGSITYMAPEKIQSEQFDHRIDIFALGLIAFEMLLGRLPVKEKTSFGYFRRYVLEDLPVAEQLAPMIGEAAAQTVQRAVQRDRDARYQSAGEFSQAFAEATAG